MPEKYNNVVSPLTQRELPWQSGHSNSTPDQVEEGACAHATQQAQRAGKAMAQAEALCRSRGARLTPIRRKVLEALYATHKPMGAYDLAEILGPRGRRLAPITVYRALDFLIEQGFVHRLASQNAYIASPNAHEEREVGRLPDLREVRRR